MSTLTDVWGAYPQDKMKKVYDSLEAPLPAIATVHNMGRFSAMVSFGAGVGEELKPGDSIRVRIKDFETLQIGPAENQGGASFGQWTIDFIEQV